MNIKRLALATLIALGMSLALTQVAWVCLLPSSPEEEGQWAYNSGRWDWEMNQPSNTETQPGKVIIYCTHTDLKGRVWSTY
jgi:hypothetical protein